MNVTGSPHESAPQHPPSLPGARLSDDVDCWLGELAVLAQGGDREARNTIYGVLRPRLTPIFRKFRRSYLWRDREGRAWTFDDLEQEAFLVFVELIEGWRSNESSLSGYIFSRMPWRLRDVLRQWTVVNRFESPSLPIGLEADDAVNLVEIRIVLESIFAEMPQDGANVLRLRAFEALPDPAIAERLGLSTRTLRRRRIEAYRLARAIYLGDD